MNSDPSWTVIVSVVGSILSVVVGAVLNSWAQRRRDELNVLRDKGERLFSATQMFSETVRRELMALHGSVDDVSRLKANQLFHDSFLELDKLGNEAQLLASMYFFEVAHEVRSWVAIWRRIHTNTAVLVSIRNPAADEPQEEVVALQEEYARLSGEADKLMHAFGNKILEKVHRAGRPWYWNLLRWWR